MITSGAISVDISPEVVVLDATPPPANPRSSNDVIVLDTPSPLQAPPLLMDENPRKRRRREVPSAPAAISPLETPLTPPSLPPLPPVLPAVAPAPAPAPAAPAPVQRSIIVVDDDDDEVREQPVMHRTRHQPLARARMRRMTRRSSGSDDDVVIVTSSTRSRLMHRAQETTAGPSSATNAPSTRNHVSMPSLLHPEDDNLSVEPNVPTPTFPITSHTRSPSPILPTSSAFLSAPMPTHAANDTAGPPIVHPSLLITHNIPPTQGPSLQNAVVFDTSSPPGVSVMNRVVANSGSVSPVVSEVPAPASSPARSPPPSGLANAFEVPSVQFRPGTERRSGSYVNLMHRDVGGPSFELPNPDHTGGSDPAPWATHARRSNANLPPRHSPILTRSRVGGVSVRPGGIRRTTNASRSNVTAVLRQASPLSVPSLRVSSASTPRPSAAYIATHYARTNAGNVADGDEGIGAANRGFLSFTMPGAGPVGGNLAPLTAQQAANSSAMHRRAMVLNPSEPAVSAATTTTATASARRHAGRHVGVAHTTSTMSPLYRGRGGTSVGSGLAFPMRSTERRSHFSQHRANVRRLVRELQGVGTAAAAVELQMQFGLAGDGALDYERLVGLDEHLHREKNRAHSNQINALPTITATADEKDVRCCICMNDVEEGEQLRVLPCAHKYHKTCIDEWLTYNGCCPVDKKRIAPTNPPPRCASHGSGENARGGVNGAGESAY